MRSTYKRYKRNQTKKVYGRGHTISKRSGSKYPPLPESPTDRPVLYVNNNNLIPPQRGTIERQKRFNNVLKRVRILRKDVPKRNTKKNKENSFFPINNKGFRPSHS